MKQFFLSWLKLSKKDWLEVIKQIIISVLVAVIFSVITWLCFLIFELTTQLILQSEIIVFVVGLVAIVTFLIVVYRNIIRSYQTPLGRESEIRRLVSHIQTGQSSAIIGEFGEERDKILKYLCHEEKELFGSQSDNLVFSLLDISTLPKKCNQAEFWKIVLIPVKEKIINNVHFTALFNTYEECQNNGFKNKYLERLFTQMGTQQLRLVLMLHRFEVLLHRPFLNREEFLGGLRSIASSSFPSPLSLIVSMKKSIKQFHKDIEKITAGSPYLNFLGTITLGALSELEIEKLLNQSKHPFDETDRTFIKEMSGGHPYLLQIAAVCLIEAHKNLKDHLRVQKKAKEEFSKKTEELLNSILQSCPPNTRKAFICIAQGNDVSGWHSELKELEKQGFIRQENGQWRVCSSVLLELVKENK